jgi:hypothetical protein
MRISCQSKEFDLLGWIRLSLIFHEAPKEPRISEFGSEKACFLLLHPHLAALDLVGPGRSLFLGYPGETRWVALFPGLVLTSARVDLK